ncbi:ATP-grasp domain-containing protein [Kitasatospora sp. NBC_01246]|uniref:carboxylate--amine ligase n=1 Tax=Kitasatospora sp. NBC_01246 TaxID=2903570 RepID=UPI002E34F0EB|nr:ATP-grasp domain-containing protein [Kitasatospora sp. NBC_01246]
MAGGPLGVDRAVPALLVKVGHYPLSHSAVGAVRSLGRLGVPVYAMVEDRLTPTALSRYLTGALVRPSTGREPPAELAAALRGVAREVRRRSGRRAVAVATDDEAAVLLAEHASELAEDLLLPPVPPGLPRRLADKGGLHDLCRGTGTPTPAARTPVDRAGLLAAAAEFGYPLVLKNLASFTRLERPVVGHTTVVRSEAELLSHCPPGASCDGPPLAVLVQEYLPAEQARDWITHLTCGPGGEPLAVFTGVKLRSWPPGAGVTTRAGAVANPELAELAVRLCRRLGYCGIADLDWRLDLRDGRYKLVDFNPRTGAQFRLFETTAGVDVVRALHLSLTGRPVPPGPQLRRGYGVGQLDLLSLGAAAWHEHRPPADPWPRRGTERAWLCADDPLPAVAVAARFGGRAARYAARRLVAAARGGGARGA